MDSYSTDVLVIGGSAAGLVTALVGKTYYPDKRFVVLRDQETALVPCGIPYIFGMLRSTEKDIIPDGLLFRAGVELVVDRAVGVDLDAKTCRTAGGRLFRFDKLVFATGSVPRVPHWLKGAELQGVFTIPKQKPAIDRILDWLQHARRVVTVGGGFIGVEVSDELNSAGKEVTIVELLPHVLGLAFDPEIAEQAEEILRKRGVGLRTGVGVSEILGEGGRVRAVRLQDGEELPADTVILAMGYRPNTALAREAGLALTEHGSIWVDEYMRTQHPDVFAVGDCADKRDFVTRRPNPVMLASTAASEARVAGSNLYRLSSVKTFNGTIAIFSTKIGELAFGAAGITETQARKSGFDIVTGTYRGLDQHPGTLPQTHEQMVKLVASRESGVLLGAEVVGGDSTGELTNLLGLAIQKKMSASELFTAQIGTHPLLTAPPTAYPMIEAARSILQALRGEPT